MNWLRNCLILSFSSLLCKGCNQSTPWPLILFTSINGEEAFIRINHMLEGIVTLCDCNINRLRLILCLLANHKPSERLIVLVWLRLRAQFYNRINEAEQRWTFTLCVLQHSINIQRTYPSAQSVTQLRHAVWQLLQCMCVGRYWGCVLKGVTHHCAPPDHKMHTGQRNVCRVNQHVSKSIDLQGEPVVTLSKNGSPSGVVVGL